MASESQKRQSGVSETLDQKRCEALARSSVRLHPGFGCGFVNGDLLQIPEVASFAIPCAGFRNSMLQEGSLHQNMFEMQIPSCHETFLVHGLGIEGPVYKTY